MSRLCKLLLLALLATGFSTGLPLRGEEPRPFILDMVQDNPGEAQQPSAFREPHFLAGRGYTGQVIMGGADSCETFDAIAPDALPKGSEARRWIEQRAATLEKIAADTHAAGIKAYAWMQFVILPKAIVAKFKDEICDEKGQIDVSKPRTQELLRAQIAELFERCPSLDGIVVRTGEIYLNDSPYHAASADLNEARSHGTSKTAITHGPESHIALLKLLREEACVKRGKTVIYRTWSFGKEGFHESPSYYLQVTNAIEPHPNLIFAIKHQAGDFHRLTPFNPTLMIGKHRQIVEVECQLEAYGKGAHPYYVGQGVIDGWEEYDWLMKPGAPRGVRDIVANPLFAGIWTWSRGGGWEGPYIKNELWCTLNAYVVSQFVRNPSRGEEEIFHEYARNKLRLSEQDAAKFRELCLLSAKAVLRGQLTLLGAKIDVWWARDHFLSAPDLSDFIKRGLVEKALAEKAESVAMWKRMEELSRQIHFADKATQDFVEISTTYGRIKYAIIEQEWTILFYGKLGDASKHYERDKIGAAIKRYDELWAEWRELLKAHPASCASLYLDVAFGHKSGVGAAIDRYRKILQGP